ncbi:MAG: M48 family metalloprotease [Candidatus Aenigmatarchaeota archaeon]
MTVVTRRVLVNPFIFPSELKFYFVLMVIIVISPALSLAFSIGNFLLQPYPFQHAFYFYLMVIPLFTFILLPYLTFVLYTRNVKSKLQYCRDKIEDVYPHVSKLIKDLCSEMKVQIPISFYVDDPGVNAIAFGFRKKPFLLVSSGLCEKLETFPKLVETVVIHELSHIKNNDIFFHEIAESLWKAFAIVGLLSSIYGLVVYREEILGWLFLVLVIYVFPLVVVFYLNNVIQKWREVYADMRTISIQGTDAHILTFLRIVFPPSNSDLFHRMLSPFTLTNIKRIQTIQDGVFKHIVERGLICSGISILTLFSSILFAVFLGGVVRIPELPFVLMLLWCLLFLFLFSVTALPYWTYKSLESENVRTALLQIFIVPLKGALVAVAPIILILSIFSVSEMQVYLFLFVYIFLAAHFIIFRLILSITSAKIEAKNKILLSESILILLPIQMTIAFSGLIELLHGSIVLVVILITILLAAAVKYSKCPHCGKDIRQFSLFECPYCLNMLNRDFLIVFS